MKKNLCIFVALLLSACSTPDTNKMPEAKQIKNDIPPIQTISESASNKNTNHSEKNNTTNIPKNSEQKTKPQSDDELVEEAIKDIENLFNDIEAGVQ